MKLTEQNVKEVLLDASMQKTVFLYFYMQDPKCEKITLSLESQISDNNQYVSLVEADIQEPVAQALAMQMGLQAVPALVIFQQGKPVDAYQGDEIVTNLKDILGKFMPSDVEVKLREALEAEAQGDLATALTCARDAHNLDEKDLQAKHIYARLLISNKSLEAAQELLANPGREEAASQNYQDLIAALNLALKAQESPEILELERKYEEEPKNFEVAISLSVALSQAGKKEKALEILFAILQKDLSQEKVKKTFLDILSTMSGDPLQGKYRRKLYTLMY